MRMNETNFTDEMLEEDEYSSSPSNPQLNEGGNEGFDEEPVNTDLTTELLRRKGITDLSKIKFEDETGAVIERPWSGLSQEEQLNILSDQTPESNDLDDDEINLINAIRNSGMSVSDYIDSLKPEQTPTQPEPSYKINELSDDEVYALDLMDRIGQENISDEEIEQAITNAKQNETLYKKTVEGIRQEYIKAQQDEEAAIANQKAAQQQADYDRFASGVVDQIRDFNSFVGQPLEMSNEDQQELAKFMLDLDDNGMSALGKALNNPRYLTEAAFWILNQDKITEEINRQMQDNYKRGYEQAKRDLQGSSKSKLVFNTTKKMNTYEEDEFI